MGKACVVLSSSRKADYPSKEYLFRPSEKYPEYEFEEISEVENYSYEAVRNGLYLMGLDKENYNTPEWNPFGTYIQEGNTVLIKPNLVMDINGEERFGTACLFTQPGVVAPVIDYVIKALKGSGKIIIGDAPMQECNFDKLINESGYDVLVQYYSEKGFDIQLVDFRDLKSEKKGKIYHSVVKECSSGVIVDLGEDSEFFGKSDDEYQRLRVSNYDPKVLYNHHKGAVQEYCISKYALQADVIINMPKPKTHKKAGITASLKNFIGINARKEFLPHHTLFSIAEGGDEYLSSSKIHRLRSRLADKKCVLETKKHYVSARFILFLIHVCTALLMVSGKNKYSSGSWYGNNTICKTIVDLNRILCFADKNGLKTDSQQRRILCIADMIVSGEGNGPVSPSPKAVGLIAISENQVALDETLCILMGFDPQKIPTLIHAKNEHSKLKINEAFSQIEVYSDCADFNGGLAVIKKNNLGFVPPSGWVGHIEL